MGKCRDYTVMERMENFYYIKGAEKQMLNLSVFTAKSSYIQRPKICGYKL